MVRELGSARRTGAELRRTQTDTDQRLDELALADRDAELEA